jgi:hypothetical protein
MILKNLVDQKEGFTAAVIRPYAPFGPPRAREFFVLPTATRDLWDIAVRKMRLIRI